MFDYYVHFNKDTGEIYSITNESSDTAHSVLKVKYNDVEMFLLGNENYVNYRVGLRDKTKFKIIKRTQFNQFNNNTVHVLPLAAGDSELTVTQCLKTNTWIFALSPEKQSELGDVEINFKLNFYIASSKNLNKLVRTINIDTVDLIENKEVYFGFNSNLETNLDMRVLSSKFFNTYSMEINYE